MILAYGRAKGLDDDQIEAEIEGFAWASDRDRALATGNMMETIKRGT